MDKSNKTENPNPTQLSDTRASYTLYQGPPTLHPYPLWYQFAVRQVRAAETGMQWCNLSSLQPLPPSRVQRLTPVIPVLWEAEAGRPRGVSHHVQQQILIYKTHERPGMVAHACNPSSLGGQDRWDLLSPGV
ncbi:hypothetical protein AAY473_006184 [Plecturocebus cupreus]